MIEENAQEQFEKELMRRGLSDGTIREYMKRWKAFPKDVPLTEELLYEFLDKYSGSIPRAFVKLYAEIHKLRDFRPPRQTGRKPVRLPKIMSEEEYLKLRVAMYNRNVKWGLMLDISYWCGMRRNEVVSLTVNNFLFDSWKGAGHPCRVKFIGKGNKERIAVVPAWLVDLILEWIEYMAEQGMPDNAKIFQVSTEWWGEVFTEVCLRVLNKRYTTHHLRHTRTSLWRKEGVTIDKVSQRLGHASISTTQRYWNMDMEEVAEEWEKELG